MSTLYPSTDPPSVSVTSHLVPGRNKTLKCLAYDFYPRGLGLRWVPAGKKQESESRVDVLPSGNGTYQSWVVMEIPLQDRGPHFCLVEHSGLAQPLSVPWEEKQKPTAKGNLETQPQESLFLPEMRDLDFRNHQKDPKEEMQTQVDLETEDLSTWS